MAVGLVVDSTTGKWTTNYDFVRDIIINEDVPAFLLAFPTAWNIVPGYTARYIDKSSDYWEPGIVLLDPTGLNAWLIDNGVFFAYDIDVELTCHNELELNERIYPDNKIYQSEADIYYHTNGANAFILDIQYPLKTIGYLHTSTGNTVPLISTDPIPVEWEIVFKKDGNVLYSQNYNDNSFIDMDNDYIDISGSVDYDSVHDDYLWTIHSVSISAVNRNLLQPGNYELIAICRVKHTEHPEQWNIYTFESNFTIKDVSKITETEINNYRKTSRIIWKGNLDITPQCVCYLNTDNNKTVNFQYTATAKVVNLYSDIPALNTIFDYIENNATYRLVMTDEADNELINQVITTNTGTIPYTFTLPENTHKNYTFKLYADFWGNTYLLDSKQVIIERQEYCHEVIVEAKLYDATGEETDVIIHPTSADYDPAKHGSYTVKLFTKNEQGTLTNMTEVIANWQYDISNSSTGIYEFTIPNTDTNCLNLGYYAVSFKITPPNGYYNRYNIEATDIVINSNRIEKVGFWNDTMNITYKNGVAILDNIYEKVSGIFANPLLEFSVAMQENTTTESKMYSFCSRIYNSPITLNLPTYTETEMTELAKTIVKELGQPRKIETYQILPKELPHLNQVINVIYSNEIRTFPIYSIELSLSNSNKIVKVKNNPSKLLKDYLSMIK